MKKHRLLFWSVAISIFVLSTVLSMSTETSIVKNRKLSPAELRQTEKQILLHLQNQPENANLWASLASIHGLQKKYDIALTDINKAALYAKRAIDIEQVGLGFYVIYSSQGRPSLGYDTSLFYIKKTIQLEPNNSSFWFDLGKIYEHGENKKLAEDAYKKAIDLIKNNQDTFTVGMDQKGKDSILRSYQKTYDELTTITKTPKK